MDYEDEADCVEMVFQRPLLATWVNFNPIFAK